MTQKSLRIVERVLTEAVPVKGGFLMLTWKNGAMGLVDLRDMIARLPVFEFLRDEDAFNAVRVEEDGSAVYWRDYEGDVIDIASDTLWHRRKPISATPAEWSADRRMSHAAPEHV